MEKFLESDSELELLAEKIAKDLAEIHYGKAIFAHFPFSINYMAHLFLEDFIKYLYKISINIKKEDIEELANKIEYPSIVAQYFHFIGGSRKYLEAEQRKNLAKILLEIISRLRKDPYCNGGKNELKNFDIKQYNFKNKSSLDGRKINFLLQSYLEIVFPTIMPLGREIHGPYPYENKKVMVKEYHKLSKFLPFKKIIVFEIYSGEAPKVDFFNHIVSKTLSPEKTFILVDNKCIDEEGLGKTIQAIEGVLSTISKYDRKKYTEFFIRNSIESLDYFGDDEGKAIITKTIQKISKMELKEELTDPYEGLTKEQIKDKLKISFSKTFGSL